MHVSETKLVTISTQAETKNKSAETHILLDKFRFKQ
jgi:hypothetical protein